MVGRRVVLWVAGLIAAAGLIIPVLRTSSDVPDSRPGVSSNPRRNTFTVAAGKTPEGRWELSLYEDEAAGWCLDLDAPGIGDSKSGRPDAAAECNLPNNLLTPIGSWAAAPLFRESSSLVYGQTSTRVNEVRVLVNGRRGRPVSTIPAPVESDLDLRFFLAFVPAGDTLRLEALDASGDVVGHKEAVLS